VSDSEVNVSEVATGRVYSSSDLVAELHRTS
jgi:hypothetical protein